MDQTRQNIKSTHKNHTIIPDAAHKLVPTKAQVDEHSPDGIDSPTHMCYASIITPTGQIFSDQTGKFVLPSSNGNNYIMIVYDFDSNFIFVQPFYNRTAKCLLETYKILHQRLC